MNEIENRDPVIEIVCFTDPYCTWCWGSEPILGKVEETYGRQVEISYRMGGLVEDITVFSDPANRIGGDDWYRQVADHWVEASHRHGMPVDEQVFYDLEDEFESTYPASIAFEAARLQGEEQGKRYLRSLRVAAAAERRAIHRLNVQLELASDIGLDLNRFRGDIESGAAERAFQEDLAECRARGVRGFPSYLIRGENGHEVLLRGYIPFETFETWFEEFAGGELIRNEMVFGLTPVHDFIARKGKTAAKELSVVFDARLPGVGRFLENLAEKGILHEQEAGNGYLYSTSRSESACDPAGGLAHRALEGMRER